jgi:hypothetical protein
MRLVIATIVLLAGLALAYSQSTLSAQTDAVPAGVRVGDTVEVTYPSQISGATFRCTVGASRDGFVRCREEDPGANPNPRPGPVTWHNLRLAWQIKVLPRDDFAIR